MKRALLASAMLASCAVLGSFAVLGAIYLEVWSSGPPDLVGNHSEHVRRMTQTVESDNFTFFVFGDTQGGTRTFERLLDMAKKDDADFAVFLGDFVRHADAAHHQFFAHEMGEQGLTFPVFLVPGEHDVGGNAKWPFGIADFERAYGPTQFHFEIGRCLFVFLNNASPFDQRGDYLRYLERVLADRAGEVDHAFVFAHKPPMGLSPHVISRELAGSDQYLELAKRFGVRYIFSGDHHGYWKGERDGTTIIVSGGGGARLRGTRGRFHHTVRISVEDGRIAETVFPLERTGESGERFEEWVTTQCWPAMTGSWFSVALAGLIPVAALACLAASVRQWKRLRLREGRAVQGGHLIQRQLAEGYR